MTAADPVALLDDLARGGVVLYLAAGKLKFKADPGAYTDERRGLVAANRAALVTALEALALGGAITNNCLDSAEGPWLPGDTGAVMPDPAGHWKTASKAVPPELAPVMGAIAAAWRRTASATLAREYSRLWGWAAGDREAVTAAWVAEQTARYDRLEGPAIPLRVSPYWRRRWAELEADGYRPGGTGRTETE